MTGIWLLAPFLWTIFCLLGAEGEWDWNDTGVWMAGMALLLVARFLP